MVNSVSYNSKVVSGFVERPASVNFRVELQKRLKNWTFSTNFAVNSFMYGAKMRLRWDKVYDSPSLYSLTLQDGEGISYGVKVIYTFGNSSIKDIKKSGSSNAGVRSRLE